MLLDQVLVVLAAYLIGAAPCGVVIARSRGVDLFRVGSGNIGATNVARALGIKWGLVVWLLDVLKGFVAVLVARSLQPGPWTVALAGMAAPTGHCFSIFLGFRGGRGIATSLGVMLATDWRVGLSAFALWIVVVAATRIVSVGSLAAAASLVPFAMLYGAPDPFQVMVAYITALGFVRHYPNLQRLFAGQEHRIGSRRREGEGGGE